MRTAFQVFVLLYCIVVLFFFGLALAEDESQTDYSRVMVVVHTTDNCAPCQRAKPAIEKLHAKHPNFWLTYYHNEQKPLTARQHRGIPFAFNGQKIWVRGHPTIAIYQEMGEGRPYQERFRVTGFASGDEEVIEMLIRRAAE